MEEEIWKPVAGYESLYEVSNMANIHSLRTNVILKHMEVKNNPLKYDVVSLFKKGKYKRMLVHRLVAIAFHPNPENKPYVDHIDGNVHNNCASNLRWCTARENINNPITAERMAKAKKGRKYSDKYKKKMSKALKGKYTGSKHWLSKKVIQFSTNGEYMKVWDNAGEIERTLGYDDGAICRVCNGKALYAYGYFWRYYSPELVGATISTPKLKKEKRKVCQLSPNGDIIRIFNCAEDARREMGLRGQGIILCCQGKGLTASGYRWRYASGTEIATRNQN